MINLAGTKFPFGLNLPFESYDEVALNCKMIPFTQHLFINSDLLSKKNTAFW